MGLSAKEKRLLDKLTKKAEEPDTPAPGRSVNFNVDLGDPKQVAAAKELGLLGALAEDDEDDDDSDDDTDEDTPRRRGFFGDDAK